MKVRTRFAPSPTGFLHIGGLRTALYNYIFAKKNNGEFILRIEDTDQKRLVENATLKIINSLKAFNIEFDEGPDFNEKYGPYKQSNRLDIYQKYYIKLIKNNSAYLCHVYEDESLHIEENQDAALAIINQKSDNSRSNSFIIKLRMPSKGILKTYDKLRGEVLFDLSLIDDPIIIKSDGFPTYHFANVVDDHLMKISHVIRGEEWLPSLPKHLLLYEKLGWEAPHFIHLPLLLNPDKSKLSKRQGDVDVDVFIEKGYLKDAIINFIALLGWHPDSDQEIFNSNQLIDKFSIKRIQKSGAIFDIKKLNWMNEQYIKNLNIDQLIDLSSKFINDDFDLSNYDKAIKVFEFIKDRMTTLEDASKLIYPFYYSPNILDKVLIECINDQISQKIIKFWYKELLEFNKITEDSINELIKLTSSNMGVSGKKIFFPLRAILYGSFHGPDLYTIISILGIDESIKRLKKYI